MRWFCQYGQCYHQKVFKTITWLAPFKVAKQETTPELSRTFRTCLRNLHTSTQRNLPEPSGTFKNLHKHAPELSTLLESSGTQTGTHWNLPAEPTPEPSGNRLQNLHQHTPEPGIVRNLPPELRNLPKPASGTYTVTRRNSPEPSGTCLRSLLRHTLELSRTFQKLHPEPTPAHTGTLRNLPESTSRRNPPEPAPATRTGTHRNPPEPAPATRTSTHRSYLG